MSLNDPQWGNHGSEGGGGKRPNQGPPDLEDLWRDLNQRLGEMFGKKGGRRGYGDNGNGGGQPPVEFNSKFLSGGIVLLVGIVILVWLASGLYIVDASERGIVLQFGRYKETTEPGLQWRLPYPIQSHELVNVSGMRALEVGYQGSVRNKNLKEALMLTDDLNIINIQFAVQWILKGKEIDANGTESNGPFDYIFNNRDPDGSVKQAAETAIREIVGKNRMDFVLYEGREQIAIQAAELMQEILDRYKTGILISKVTMQDAQPPEQVQAAFVDAVKAGQDRERQINEGQAYANDVIPRARGTAARLAQEADGYRQRLIATAEGDASRFQQLYTEYAKAPEVTRNRLYLETMQQVYTHTTKVMIDATGQGNILYLPLDKLMQAAGAVAPFAGTDTAAGRSGGVAPGELLPQTMDRADTRSRDALRSRDREPR
jgi:membrane protease subunit HflK